MPRFQNIHTKEIVDVTGPVTLEYVEASNWTMLPESPRPTARQLAEQRKAAAKTAEPKKD
jgi:hypothetical protein